MPTRASSIACACTWRPHERLRHVLPDVAAPDTRLTARLVDTADDLATDDRAYAVVPGIARARVLRDR